MSETAPPLLGVHRFVRCVSATIHAWFEWFTKDKVCESRHPVGLQVFSRDGVERTSSFCFGDEKICGNEDLIVYERLYDAVVGIDDDDGGLLFNDRPDDLLFLFCESSASMVDAIDRVAVRFGHLPRKHRFRQVYGEKDAARAYRNNKCRKGIRACLVRDLQPLHEFVWGQQNNAGGDHRSIEMTLREFRKFKEQFCHVLATNDQDQPGRTVDMPRE